MKTARGVTLIELLVIVAIIGLLVGLLLPAVQASRESARRLRCQSNLRQIGLALANYETALGVYPFGVGGKAPQGYKARWSAQSQMLPYLEQGTLFSSMNFGLLPWGHDPDYSPQNQTTLSTKVDLFLCPSDTDQIAEEFHLAHNNYRASAGTLPINLTVGSSRGDGRNDGVFWYQSSTRPASVSDGMSTTAFFSERCLGNSSRPDVLGDYYVAKPTAADCDRATTASPRYGFDEIEWSGQRWADGNVYYTRYHHILTPNRPSCNFGVDDFQSLCIVTATSRHPGGINVLMGDGAVRFVRDGLSPTVWRALGTIAGGGSLGSGDF